MTTLTTAITHQNPIQEDKNKTDNIMVIEESRKRREDNILESKNSYSINTNYR